MIVKASFEDIIYVILGLVWVIYSAYNAKKKKKAKENPSTSSKKPSFLESVINEIGLTDDKKPAVISEPYQDTDYYKDDVESKTLSAEDDEPVFSYDDYYEESNYKPVNNVIETVRANSANNNNDSETKNKVHIKKRMGSRKKIDLRKAVIYSVILKKVNF